MPGEKRQITRNRTSYSCQACRRRKVKCDKQHPICGTCKKTDEICVYGEDEPAAPSTSQIPDQEGSRKRTHAAASEAVSKEPSLELSLGARLQSIHELLNQVFTLVGNNPGIFHAVTSHEVDETLSTQAEGSNYHGEPSNNSSLATRNGRRSNDDPLSKGEQQGGTHIATKSESAALVAKISGQLSNLNFLFMIPKLDNASHRAGLSSFQSSFATNDELGGAVSPSRASTMYLDSYHTGRVASEEHGNILFRTWLISVYTVLPIIDPHQAKRLFDTFHDWHRRDMDRDIPNPVDQEMPLIYAIMYGGLKGLSVRGIRKWFHSAPRKVMMSEVQKRYFRSAQQTKASWGSVAAEVMMRHMCHGRPSIPEAASQLATLIRNAQMHGLHRSVDPDTKSSHSDTATRLWWEVVHIDNMQSMATNLPSLLDAQFFDDILPSELKTFQYTTTAGRAYEKSLKLGMVPVAALDEPFDDIQSSLVSVYNSVCRARATVTIAMRNVSRIVLGAKSVQPTDVADLRTVLASLRTAVGATINRIPTDGEPELGPAPPPSHIGQSVSMDHGTVFGEGIKPGEIDHLLGKQAMMEMEDRPFQQQIELSKRAFHRWARVALSALVDQVCCFGFGPFVRGPETVLWNLIRSCALEACHNFFRKYIMLATALEFERFRWTWFSMFQPVHAAKILLSDVHELPFSTNSIRSRALFDKVLQLCHPQYGLVGGDFGLTFVGPFEQAGSDVCSLLMELRTKAWQKAGLDPAYLWSEEDQLQVAFDMADPSLHQIPPRIAVRADQLKVPSLLSEDEWQLNTFDLGAPFKGLNELIQKIRASSSSNKDKPLKKVSDPVQAVGSNLFGDHMVKSTNDATPIESTDITSVSSGRHQGRVTRSRDKHTMLLSDDVSHQVGNHHVSERLATINPNSSANQISGYGHGENAETAWSKIQDTLQQDSIAQPAGTDNGHTSTVTSSTHSYINSNPTPDNSGSNPLDASQNFDWHRWDTLFGHLSNSNIQDMDNADLKMFMDAFKDS